MTTSHENTKSSEVSIKETMNIVIVGHVDHGKSTLLGRYTRIPEPCQLEKLRRFRTFAENKERNLNTRFCLMRF